jgi:hypothetical protein
MVLPNVGITRGALIPNIQYFVLNQTTPWHITVSMTHVTCFKQYLQIMGSNSSK